MRSPPSATPPPARGAGAKHAWTAHDKLTAEVLSRMSACADLLAHGLFGFGDLEQAASGALRLAQRAALLLAVAQQERQFRAVA